MAYLIYSRNGGAQYEEWFRASANLAQDNKVIAILPKGTSHYFLNLIDENNFLRSYPEVLDAQTPRIGQLKSYSNRALKAQTMSEK